MRIIRSYRSWLKDRSLWRNILDTIGIGRLERLVRLMKILVIWVFSWYFRVNRLFSEGVAYLNDLEFGVLKICSVITKVIK